MECTGCGSKNNFYKDCNNLNRAAYREKKLEEIRSKVHEDQKKRIRSFYMQVSDEDSSHESKCSETDQDQTRDMTDEFKSSPHESMFLESSLNDQSREPVFEEFMTTQTRHIFFGSMNRSKSIDPIGVRKGKKSLPPRLRHPSSLFLGIIIEYSSTGLLCNEAQLKAYRLFTGDTAPVRLLKHHHAVSAHCESKCTCIATFKFPLHDVFIVFGAPIA